MEEVKWMEEIGKAREMLERNGDHDEGWKRQQCWTGSLWRLGFWLRLTFACASPNWYRTDNKCSVAR